VKVDFSRALKDLKGEPIKTDEGELTLERVAVSSLLQPAKDETGDSKYKKYGIIKQIHGAAEPVELKSEDVSLVKRAIGESQFTAIVTGQAWDLLEGAEK
jgi:hypothetical protein